MIRSVPVSMFAARIATINDRLASSTLRLISLVLTASKERLAIKTLAKVNLRAT